jgi:hypothetical protein
MRQRVPVASAAALAALAAVLALAGAAGAGPAPARVDLSTDAAVRAYLTSIGVNSATTVIQRGLNNYAGPNCPGLGWNCTTAASVVQVATGPGINIYEGNPEFFANGPPPFPVPDSFVTASSPIGETCVAVQETGSGHNHARCFQRSTSNPATLSFTFTQENVEGDNFIQVHQQIRQREGAEQTAHEDVEITQTTFSGNNHLHVISQIHQTSQTEESLQEQDGTFNAVLTQNSGTGNNVGTLRQDLIQDGKASGLPETVQHQIADQKGLVDQFATGPASILSNGDDQGFSQFHAHQSKSQSLTGPGLQMQDDPGSCCGAGTQTGDEQQTFMKILQESDQHASQGEAEQDLTLLGSCNSDGSCEITHHARNDADSITAREEGTGPTFLTTRCQSTEFGGGEGSGVCEDPSED